MKLAELNFGPSGLLPVVVQHAASGQVLMVGFANPEAVERTLASGLAWFYSRSRKQLWQKGETSQNLLRIKGIRVDCDADTLLYVCEPAGPTCHTGSTSCFFEVLEGATCAETSGEAAGELFRTIKQRQLQIDPSTSYVARLLSQGLDRVARKIGEEAAEVIIAAKNQDREELANEMADLWFHTYVLLAQQGMTPEDVWQVLRARRRP